MGAADCIAVRFPITNFHVNKQLRVVISTRQATEWERGGQSSLAEATAGPRPRVRGDKRVPGAAGKGGRGGGQPSGWRDVRAQVLRTVMLT